MKYALIALLAALSPVGTSAQKHHVFADAGIPFPAFSVTYDHKFAKHWSAGAGVQGCRFYPTAVNTRKFVPALFGDVRLHIRPEKNNQFFSFLDLGMNFFRLDDNYYRDSSIVYHVRNNGFYTGLGIGYFRRITERGWGPYLSLKMLLNWNRLDGYSIVSSEQDVGQLDARGAFALSVGFKF